MTMTGLLPEERSGAHQKEFSRKSFIQASGAVVAGLTMAGAAQAATGNTPIGARTPNDYLALGDPRLTQVDTWLAISPQNKVIVTHGETEFTGAPTGILMLVAEELNITDMSMMVYAHPESWLNSIGGGGGSGAISSRSTVCRAAAAQALKLLMNAASTQLGVPVGSLSASNGVISGGGKTVKYSDLYGGKTFNFDLATLNPAVTTTTGYIPGQGNTKPVSQYQLVGKLVHRIDIPAKVGGTYTYVQNVRVPGMVHARRVRPRGAGANASQNHYPLSVDPKSIAHIPGAQVVQINNFLAVVAPHEFDAIQAAAQLKVVWKDDPKFSVGSGNYWSWLRQQGDTNTVNPARWVADTGSVPAAMASAAKTVSATYKYHYNTYVPIGPHCAIADVKVGDPNDPTKNSATIYFCAQGTNPASGMGAGGGSTTPISTILGALPKPINIPVNQVRLIWFEGSGSYGAGQSPQASEEAAVISATIGKPVRMQWMRWDQTGWDSWGTAHLYDVTMGANAAGTIVASDWTSYGQAGSTIDTDQELLGQVTWPATPPNGGPTPSDGGSAATPYGNTNYGAAYQFQRRVLAKSQPFYGGSLKSTALRAPNAPQTYFASEQIVDELAHAMGIDPYTFRKKNIDGTATAGARWLAVLDGAVQAAGYKPRLANSVAQTGTIRTGVGIGFGTFANSQCCTVANVEVNMKTGKLLAKHLTLAQNNGITVNLDGVGNQMSGAVIQGLSRAMYEQATWNQSRVTTLDWVTYPILRFKDAPSVTLVNVHPGTYTTVIPGDETLEVFAGNTAAQANGWLLTGSGEPPTSAVGSAMANAFFDATGVRIRQAPMTPAATKGALKGAGVLMT
jgi:CO/xanthine dehydrogenase Mo-binding subunit